MEAPPGIRPSAQLTRAQERSLFFKSELAEFF
jgi:hypothetical protein